MNAERWEHGSDPHWQDPDAALPWTWPHPAALFGSGRHALVALLDHGRWRRLWVPSFFCQEVTVAFAAPGRELVPYADNPLAPARDLRALPVHGGDAILVSNTLGLRAGPPDLPRCDVIEDHTHDLASPWSRASTAAYVAASLRKIVPVPDGGILWSPAGRGLPVEPPCTDVHAIAAGDKLAAMVLKRAYLAGGAVDKAQFRARAVAGEQQIAAGAVSGAAPVTSTALPGFPLARWREVRDANFRAFAAALGEGPWQLLAPEPGAVAYTATLVFATPELRERHRSNLIANRIYPAVLWSQDQPVVEVPAADRDLAARILSLHCDHRYTAADLQRVAQVLRA